MTEGFVNGRQVKAQMREELDLQDIDAQESCTKLSSTLDKICCAHLGLESAS